MSSTTQPTTFADLYQMLLNRVRISTSEATSVTHAKAMINTALFDMCIGFREKVPWLERRAQLRTKAQYATGTITVAQGATSVTGSGTAWNTANAFGETNLQAGGKIVIAGSAPVYEVASVASDTALTLTSRYVGESVTAGGYLYFEDEYALASDFLRPADIQFFDDRRSIEIVSRTDFRNMVPRNAVPSRPVAGCILDLATSSSTTPRRRLALTPPPSTTFLLPYTYITGYLARTSAGAEQTQLSGDTDEPIVPLEYRHAIVLHALKNWYRDKKDDGRSQEVNAEYTDLVARMVGDNEVGAKRPRLQPMVGPYVARARRPWGDRGRYDASGWFDSLADRGL